ncbi:hypothetical protein ACE6H2_001152 [Prunus campanulata]
MIICSLILGFLDALGRDPEEPERNRPQQPPPNYNYCNPNPNYNCNPNPNYNCNPNPNYNCNPNPNPNPNRNPNYNCNPNPNYDYNPNYNYNPNPNRPRQPSNNGGGYPAVTTTPTRRHLTTSATRITAVIGTTRTTTPLFSGFEDNKIKGNHGKVKGFNDFGNWYNGAYNGRKHYDDHHDKAVFGFEYNKVKGN